MLRTDIANLATDETMPLHLMVLEAADEVGIDTETTGLNVRNGVDYLTGISYCADGIYKGYIPFRHNSPDNVQKRWLKPLFEILPTKILDGHNWKFELHSFKTIGIDSAEVFKNTEVRDCLQMAQLVNEEWPSKELDWLCKILLKDEKAQGDEIKALGQLIGWANIKPHEMNEYASHDAYLHYRLANVLWSKLVSQQLESVYRNTESPFTTTLYQMEQRGVGVNRELTDRMAERGRGRLSTIARKLHFNPASSVDLGNYLLKELDLPVLGLTPKGKPSFAKAIMEQYDDILQASNNPTAQLIAEYRGWQKATTSLYEPLLRKIGPDGRIRTEFKQHGTVTGRLSASDPNLQQIPRGSDRPWNGHAKACFNAVDPAFGLLGWDYSQLELRLAAHYGNEEVLLAEFAKEDSDPFKVLCWLIFEQFDSELRHKTKNCFVYPSLYGAGLTKVAAQLGRPIEETRELYEKYQKSIPGITAVSKRVDSIIKQRGYVRYWDGRRRHMRNKDDSFKAWNSVVQGGGAQMVKQAMLRCRKFEDNDCFMVLTVHDEITFMIRREAIPDYEPKIIKAMTDWPQFKVKFAVEGKEWK